MSNPDSGAYNQRCLVKSGTPKRIRSDLLTGILLFMVGKCIASDSMVTLEIDDAVRLGVINNTQQLIQNHYVEVSKIPKIVNALEALKGGTSLATIEDISKLSELLKTHLQASDKHFSVSIDPMYLKPHNGVDPLNKKPPVKETWFQKLARQNYGFERVEVLENNIGIISFWGFADLNSGAKAAITGYLGELKDVDALIIDLSKNGGGSAQTVQFISSFFLPGRVHLNSFYSRVSDTTQDFYTDESINYTNLNQIPIVIVVGPETFSAAEEFAYNFKHLSRAIVIGKPTKGGANPWRYFEISHGLRVAIPISKAINPITQTNWEGVGVQPQLLVELATAETTAIGLLLEQLKER